jgi:serine kinase of HPr protein (carbohydrate metabolism regulator)
MPAAPPTRDTDTSGLVAASCVATKAGAVLIRGPSGSGKSSLAWQLIRDGATGATLVGDDQVRVTARAGKLIAAPAPGLAGRIELRGLGILPVDHAAEAEIALIADIVAPEDFPRLPEPREQAARLFTIEVPRIAIERHSALSLLRVATALDWLAAGRSLAELTGD